MKYIAGIPLLACVFGGYVPIVAAQVPHKIAIVVSGHADPWLKESAMRVERVVAQDSTLSLPESQETRETLRGNSAATTPPNRELLMVRRGLGLGEARDSQSLQMIGNKIGTRALVIIRRRAHRPELIVFDVKHGAFYAKSLDLQASSDARIALHVMRRVLRSVGGIAAPALEKNAQYPGLKTRSEHDSKSWFEKHWTYLVLGGLLGGIATGILIAQRADDPPQTVLRFKPGG